MVTNILLYSISFLLKQIADILPEWSIWPDEVLAGLYYFFANLAKLNIILPLDVIFDCLLFFINFIVIYFTAKLVLMVINFFRGSGEIKI